MGKRHPEAVDYAEDIPFYHVYTDRRRRSVFHGGIVLIPNGVVYLQIAVNGKLYCIDDTTDKGIAECDGRVPRGRLDLERWI